jgi:hypothetical protein
MIILWIKITWYKIIKLVGRRNRADTGGEPRTGAHAQDAGRHLAPVRMNTARLNEMIAKGIVYAPDEHGDLLRVELFEAEKEAREIRAALAHDPRECPCSGHHYPSADSCRWCRCHDPLLRYHSEIPPQITEMIRLVDIAGTNCMWCGHPAHPDGGRCVRSAEGMPGNPDGSRFMCGCVAGIEMIVEGTVDGIRPHRPMSAGDADLQERAYRDMTITPEAVDEIMASSPAKKIARCPRCGHPQHYGTDSPRVCWAGGRCRCTGQAVPMPTETGEDGHS